MRWQQHRVVARGIERAVGAIDDLGLGQCHAALGLKIVQDKFVLHRHDRLGCRCIEEPADGGCGK